MAKRLFDLCCAGFGLVVTLPLIAFISLAIKCEDGGNIFYRGRRVGKHGTLFNMLKFRTMVMNADKLGGPSTANDDNRITAVGKRLRRLKLDEIPQLFNVIKGEMSLVGPRPEVECYVKLYTPEEKVILTVRPGITDWASIWNADEGAVLAGSSDPERDYLEKIRPTKLLLQQFYAKNLHLRMDLQIIYYTLRAIVSRKTMLPKRIAVMAPPLGRQSEYLIDKLSNSAS